MKGIIIYQSVYGTTRQYGELIAEKSGYRLLSYQKVKKNDLLNAETVVIGSYLFADKIKISDWVIKRKDLLKNKTIRVYSTSGAKPSDPKLNDIFKRDFKDLLNENIQYFPLGGRQIFNKLNGKDRMLMKIGAKMQKDPKIAEKMLQDVDNFDRDGAIAVLDSIKT